MKSVTQLIHESGATNYMRRQGPNHWVPILDSQETWARHHGMARAAVSASRVAYVLRGLGYGFEDAEEEAHRDETGTVRERVKAILDLVQKRALEKKRLAKIFDYTDGNLERKDVGICLDNMEPEEVEDLFAFMEWSEGKGKARGDIMATVGHDLSIFIAKLRDGVEDGSTPRTNGYRLKSSAA